MTVTFDEVRDKLLTLDQARNLLLTTEPLDQTPFKLHGSETARFVLDSGWNADLAAVEGTDPVKAYVTIGEREYQLTKDAILEAGSLIGLPKVYLTRTPATLMAPHLNYWFTNKEKDVKLLSSGPYGLAFAKGGIEPFSNLRLLDEALSAIESEYGKTEVFVDYKMAHSLRHTAMRLVIPETEHRLNNGHDWCAGVQLKNSLVGETPLQLQGYLFSYVCTNGATSTHASSGAWNRRTGGQKEDDVMAWARAAVDDIFQSLDDEFEALNHITDAEIPETDIAAEVRDMFTTYKIPLQGRQMIIAETSEWEGRLTMYDLMQIVTQVANGKTVPETIRTSLMEIGGDIPRAHASRCAACHRIQPSS